MNEVVKISYSKENTHIENSHMIDNYSTMQYCVEQIIKDRKIMDYPVTRSINSYIREWRGHNKLYKFDLFKSHTKDVDLEEPIKWYMELIWIILGK